ncbi:uncharacterized protein J3R85_013881 [Psidium guajava]|nr:uncharacterized protein J3R85_013881 [Psidium guajava]
MFNLVRQSSMDNKMIPLHQSKIGVNSSESKTAKIAIVVILLGSAQQTSIRELFKTSTLP